MEANRIVNFAGFEEAKLLSISLKLAELIKRFNSSTNLSELRLGLDLALNSFVYGVPVSQTLHYAALLAVKLGYWRMRDIILELLNSTKSHTLVLDADAIRMTTGIDTDSSEIVLHSKVAQTKLHEFITPATNANIIVCQLVKQIGDGLHNYSSSSNSLHNLGQSEFLSNNKRFPVKSTESFKTFAQESASIYFASNQPMFIADRNIGSLPSDYQELAREEERKSTHPVITALCKDVSVLAWQNSTAQGLSSQHLVPLDKNGVLYPAISPSYLPFYLPFDQVETAGSKQAFVINPSPFYTSEAQIDQPCLFVGSIANFGHWMLDFLPHAILAMPRWQPMTIADTSIGRLIAELPIVTSPLQDWQRQSLEFLGLENRVIELDTVPGELKLVRFSEMWFTGGLSLPNKFKYLQECFLASYRRSVNYRTPHQPSKVYITRTKWSSTNGEPQRVKNHLEIAGLFESEGFFVLDAEDYTYFELIDVLSNASIVAVDPGSPRFNAFLFAPTSTLFISLYPKPSFRNELSIERDGVWHIPFLERTIFVFGNEIESGDPLISPVSYSSLKLVEAIRRAELVVSAEIGQKR